MRSRTRCLEFLIGDTEGLFCARAFHGFALQRLVHPRQVARLAEQLHEHRDLRSKDLGVDGLGQVVDRARAVTAQDVLFVEHVRGQEQDRHVTRSRRAP